MKINKKQAIEVASTVLHKMGCCSFIEDLPKHLKRESRSWKFRSPTRGDLGAKDGAVEIRIFDKGGWEGHNYQQGDNLFGTYAVEISVSISEL